MVEQKLLRYRNICSDCSKNNVSYAVLFLFFIIIFFLNFTWTYMMPSHLYCEHMHGILSSSSSSTVASFGNDFFSLIGDDMIKTF